MKIYHSETHRQHAPAFEIFDGGERIENFEVPERMDRIIAALHTSGYTEILPPGDFGLQPILAVHNPAYIGFLQTAFEEWMREETDYKREALLPATFPPAGWRRLPDSLLGRAGFYMTDLSAPIVGGTYQAALHSAFCALSAARALTLDDRASFALCRPPGHHAGRANCGGYCYLNNAAIAANYLSLYGKVAILDIDYHAGNGTQDIFYERADVLSISIHGDPNQEYPYFSGYADERGMGSGLGYHYNYPLATGTDDAHYLATLKDAIAHIREYSPKYLVLSAGMDLYTDDPLGKFEVTRAGINEIGKYIAGMNIPSAIIMEGGYNNDALGDNVVSLLKNFG